MSNYFVVLSIKSSIFNLEILKVNNDKLNRIVYFFLALIICVVTQFIISKADSMILFFISLPLSILLVSGFYEYLYLD